MVTYLNLESFGKLERLSKLRSDILSSPYHLCTQKASLLTNHFRKLDRQGPFLRKLSSLHFVAFEKAVQKTARGIPQGPVQLALNKALNKFYLKKQNQSKAATQAAFAKGLAHVLKKMELKVYDHELIVGNLSSHRVGAPIHPDLGGLMMLPELDSLDTRDKNPIQTDPKQIQELKTGILPYWFNKSVLSRIPLYSANPQLFNQLLEGDRFILTQFSGISHVTPDYPLVITQGFNGIRKRIKEKLSDIEQKIVVLQTKSGPGTGNGSAAISLKERFLFLEAGLTVCNAAIEYGHRWKKYLSASAAKEKDGTRKRELETLADLFDRIPAEPASTFHEALQSVFITHVILHQESFQHGISFGRMDQYLFPLYKKGLEDGTLTREFAVELIGCFLCKTGELLPLFFDRATEYFSGLSSASGITLGGKGIEPGNDLPSLFLIAYDRIRLRQPNFHVRVEKDLPDHFLDLCCSTLKKGGGLPAFFNDDKIMPALEQAGMEQEDAENYSIVGCVEWGCPGKSFPAAGAVFINMPLALHLALHQGRLNGSQAGPDSGSVSSMTSIEDLMDAFDLQLETLVGTAVEGNNAVELTHALHRPTPCLSILVEGCLEKGVEVNDGGAIYNTTGCQGVGLADVVDSLSAIETLVFRENSISLPALVKIVDNNFADQEKTRARILNKVPGYGQDKALSNGFAKRVSKAYTHAVQKHSNPRKGPYLSGLWSMTTHVGFGSRTPALPNGRLSGLPLSNGASPCNGMDSQGPTASMASAAFIDKNIQNGYALNQKLNFDLVKGANGNHLMNSLIKGFFQKGGMQVQFNIVDPGVLARAKSNPQNYRDLVVRVSGYSAYFNDLTEAMKDELIQRTLHCGIEEGCCG